MAIKIHHGPNGSYKTSGAIQDDLIPAIRAGRYIITNIRGLTRERVFQVFPDTPPSLEVLNLNLEDLDDLERMRSWFQWAPRGAFIIFDETQLIFLTSWRDSDLKKFDYPGGSEAAKQDQRPIGWLDAWTRHRHFNWDVILTTPNIKYIREDIRLTAEKAYLHSNLAVIGVKGRYKESQHSAQENKPPASHTVVEIKKINKETFKLYDSTATGAVTDTIAGKNLFKQPKLLLFLAIPPILAWSAFSDMGGSRLLGSAPADTAAVAQAPIAAGPAPVSIPIRPAAADARHDVPDVPGDQVLAPVRHPFQGASFVIRGSLHSQSQGWRYLFEVVMPNGAFQQSDSQLRAVGYRVVYRGDCAADIYFETAHFFAICSGADRAAERLVSERSGEVGRPLSASAYKPSAEPLTIVADGDYASKPWRSKTGYGTE